MKKLEVVNRIQLRLNELNVYLFKEVTDQAGWRDNEDAQRTELIRITLAERVVK